MTTLPWGPGEVAVMGRFPLRRGSTVLRVCEGVCSECLVLFE